MKMFLITHSHRHGVDAFMLMAEEEPTIEQVVKACDLDYEPDREETIDISETIFIRVIEGDKVVGKIDVVSDNCLHAEIVNMRAAAAEGYKNNKEALDPGMRAGLEKCGQLDRIHTVGEYYGSMKICEALLRKCGCGMWRKVT